MHCFDYLIKVWRHKKTIWNFYTFLSLQITLPVYIHYLGTKNVDIENDWAFAL